MNEISITQLLSNMSQEKNYEDDLWKICLNKKGQRYRRKDISTALKKLVSLGLVKKTKISGTDIYYDKLSYPNPEDYIGFVNDLMFRNESTIKESIKKLENNKIFVDITKDLNSYKISDKSKKNYEKLLEAFSSMNELASSILLIKDSSSNEKFKKQLTICSKEIKETLEKANEKIIRDRKTNETIILQRRFDGRIPSPGHLKV